MRVSVAVDHFNHAQARAAVSIEFLVTSLVVIVSPGTGVLFTLAAGLSRDSRASVVAAFGCTLITEFLRLARSSTWPTAAAGPVKWSLWSARSSGILEALEGLRGH